MIRDSSGSQMNESQFFGNESNFANRFNFIIFVGKKRFIQDLQSKAKWIESISIHNSGRTNPIRKLIHFANPNLQIAPTFARWYNFGFLKIVNHFEFLIFLCHSNFSEKWQKPNQSWKQIDLKITRMFSTFDFLN